MYKTSITKYSFQGHNLNVVIDYNNQITTLILDGKKVNTLPDYAIEYLMAEELKHA